MVMIDEFPDLYSEPLMTEVEVFHEVLKRMEKRKIEISTIIRHTEDKGVVSPSLASRQDLIDCPNGFYPSRCRKCNKLWIISL